MASDTITIINQTAPYGASNAQESLELAMAMSNFGMQVEIFFVGDGVFQLKRTQTPHSIHAKAYVKSFAALEFYDIEDIYVCEQSLKTRNLTINDLVIPVRLVSVNDFTKSLANNNQVMVF